MSQPAPSIANRALFKSPRLSSRAALIAACISCFVTLMLAASGSDRPQLLAQGLLLAKAGQHAAALEAFAQFKQQHPEDVRSYLYSAQAMIESGREKDAALELDDASTLLTGAGQEVVAYAQARVQLGHLREAARALAQVEESPDLPPEGLWLLADIYYRLKDAKQALRVFDRFAQRRPDDPRLKLRRGQILIYLEQFEPALTTLEEWVWENPYSAEGHFEMARTLRYGNNPEAARKSAERAVQLDPDNPEYLHMLGIICDSLKQHEEAVQSLERAAASPEAFTRIYFDLGNALRRAGATEKAQEVLRKYREIFTREEKEANDSKRIDALLNQAQLQLQNGAVAEAVDSFSRILAVQPNHWLAHSYLAKLYLSSGNVGLAQPHVQKLDELDPESSEGAFLISFFWYERGDYQRALTYARRSRKLRPGDAQTRNLLGNIYFAIGDMESAADEYAAATALAPDRFDFKANYEAAKRRLQGSGNH